MSEEIFLEEIRGKIQTLRESHLRKERKTVVLPIPLVDSILELQWKMRKKYRKTFDFSEIVSVLLLKAGVKFLEEE